MKTLVYSITIIIKTIDCDFFVYFFLGGNMKNILTIILIKTNDCDF